MVSGKNTIKNFEHIQKDSLNIPPTVYISNFTDYKDFDIISKIIVNKIFKYDTLFIQFRYMPPDLESTTYDTYQVKGFIVKNVYYKHSYLIFVTKSLKEIEYLKFLCHELVHLQQFESKKLIPLDVLGTDVIFNGIEVCTHRTPYELRPYEIEAAERENEVFVKLRPYIYKYY